MTASEDLLTALEVLHKGGIVLYPTDTIWGLGCDATNDEAVKRIFEIKNRPDSKAMISLIDSSESLKEWIENLPAEALEEIEKTDSPLTIIYDTPKGISSLLKANDGSAAFRIPRYDFTRELCKKLGKPLVSTSANISGSAAPRTFLEIPEEIKESADYICFTGRGSKASKSSRIVKITNDGKMTVIRE